MLVHTKPWKRTVTIYIFYTISPFHLDTLRPQQPENDRATLRRLVSELKDVLHRIHNANPETHNPIEDATVK